MFFPTSQYSEDRWRNVTRRTIFYFQSMRKRWLDWTQLSTSCIIGIKRYKLRIYVRQRHDVVGAIAAIWCRCERLQNKSRRWVERINK